MNNILFFLYFPCIKLVPCSSILLFFIQSYLWSSYYVPVSFRCVSYIFPCDYQLRVVRSLCPSAPPIPHIAFICSRSGRSQSLSTRHIWSLAFLFVSDLRLSDFILHVSYLYTTITLAASSSSNFTRGFTFRLIVPFLMRSPVVCPSNFVCAYVILRLSTILSVSYRETYLNTVHEVCFSTFFLRLRCLLSKYRICFLILLDISWSTLASP